jgi:ABC-type transporter Mla subunit MlaD
MTSEERERAVDFVIKQQAQFTTSLGRVENTLETVVNVMAQVADTQLKWAEAQANADSRIAELAGAQKRTDDAMAETTERLNSLIVVVERYFSNGRGGSQ